MYFCTYQRRIKRITENVRGEYRKYGRDVRLISVGHHGPTLFLLKYIRQKLQNTNYYRKVRALYCYIRKTVNWGTCAKTSGTFRRETVRAAQCSQFPWWFSEQIKTSWGNISTAARIYSCATEQQQEFNSSENKELDVTQALQQRNTLRHNKLRHIVTT